MPKTKYIINEIDFTEFPDGRLTMRDAAKYLGIKYSSLKNRYKKEGQAPYVKIHNRIFFFRADLDSWIKSHRKV